METVTAAHPCKSVMALKTHENPLKSRSFSMIPTHQLTGDIREAISSTLSYAAINRLIDSCVDSKSLEFCHQVHDLARRKMKKPDPFLETKLVGMFAKCGSLSDALLVFDEMRERNLYAWSAIIGAFSRAKQWREVVEMFCRMMEEGDWIPDDFLFPKILQACGNSGNFECGRVIHGKMIKLGRNDRIRVNNSILAVYAKCGVLDSAKAFFDQMEVKDTVSWNAMIKGHCRAGRLDEAHRLFDSMCKHGHEPDIITWNMLISSWTQLGNCDFSIKLMKEMEKSGLKPDVYTWTSLIIGLSYNNRDSLAGEFFREMLLSGVELNDVALMCAVSACSKDVRKAEEVHSIAVKSGYGERVLVGNSLIDMYSKHGDLEAAYKVFNRILIKDVYSWNSMIGGYCKAGYCGVAHDLFKLMQESSDISPNVVTWNTMISGYIQNGDEDQAMDLFNSMEMVGGVKRDTASWNALISGYLHHGRKDEAFQILRLMRSSGFRPNSVTVLSILPACANLLGYTKLKEIHCCILRCNLHSEIPVANLLIDTYAKSGSIKYSKAIFDGVLSPDMITWNTMLNGFVLHGRHNEAILLFGTMRELDITPNRSTFVSILSAYALAKMVDEGIKAFSEMVEKFQITPCLDHYVALVNIYGRAGKLDEALDAITSMNIEPDITIWSALLTACCKHGNSCLSAYATEKLRQLEPENEFIRNSTQECSWILSQNMVLTFITSDLSHLDNTSISWIRSIETKAKELKRHHRFLLDEDESLHSEKVALAFPISRYDRHHQPLQSVRIMKNMRMCDGCHDFMRLVSESICCEIFVSDTKCLHHFKHGTCSCGDYW